MNKPWIKLIRDVILIHLATFLGGFVVGTSGANGQEYVRAIFFSNLICIICGFFLIGLLSPHRRYANALKVAAIFWLTNLWMLFFGNTILNAVFQIPSTLLEMATGISLSYLFVKTPKVENNSEILTIQSS